MAHAYRTGLLILQPTTFCNLDCTYCYLPNRSDKTFMRADTAVAAMRNLRESGLLGDRLSVVWHAGEPLAAPFAFYAEAMPAVAAFADAGLEVRQSVQTNGTLLTPAHCELFRRHGVGVGLSLDGPAFLHDAYRVTRGGRGTHAAVMAGLRMLQAHGLDPNVIAVLTNASLDHPDEIHDFFVAAGVRQVGFNIDEREGIHHTTTYAAPAAAGRYEAFMRRFFDLCPEGGPLAVREFEEFAALLRHGRGPGVNHQAEPFAIVNVAADGDYGTFSPELLDTPDPGYGGFRLGNVHRGRITDSLRNLRALALFEDVAAGVAACRDGCPYFDLCGGGAPSNKLAENGTFRSTETLACRYTIKTLADVLMAAHERRLDAAAGGAA